MNMLKRIKSLSIVILLICGLCFGFFGAVEVFAVNGGINFTAEGYWATEKFIEISSAEFTMESWICFPKNQSKNSRGGVILGNYGGNGNVINVEVFSNGNPRVFFIGSSGAVTDYKFDSVDLYNGEWTHLAVTCDGKELKCYINGVMKQKLKITLQETIAVNSSLVVGGDYRVNNAQYFKGNIKSVAIWSDERTQNEISKDKNSVSGDDLLAYYNFEKISSNAKSVKNGVEGGTALKYVPIWFKDKKEVTDYDYSFAVIGDTQTICYYTPDKFGKIYDYILDNVEKKKIKYVFGLGDITEKSSAPEWEVATANIRRMDGIVPYSVIRGNHDYISSFNTYCPVNQYGFNVDATYDETPLNTYRAFSVNGIDYLLVTLDYGPSDDVLNWAGDIIAKHPKHNVIITTHAYLHHDGTTLEESDAATGGWIPTNDGGYNNGDDIWDKLVSKHENIVLVLSGHIDCDNVVVTHNKGVNGNTVTQMLVNPQTTDRVLGACGMVAMLYFSNGGRHVNVEYYSSVRDKYFLTTNQFEMDIAVVGVSKDAGLTDSDKDSSSDGDNSSSESSSSSESNTSSNGSSGNSSNSSTNSNTSTESGTSSDTDSSVSDNSSAYNSTSSENESTNENNSSTGSSIFGENISSDESGLSVDNNSSNEENNIENSDNSNSSNINSDNSDEKKPASGNSKSPKTNILAFSLAIIFALLVAAFTVIFIIKIIKSKK